MNFITSGGIVEKYGSKPMVTIGLPFSDQPVHQLENALRSIFAQTYKDWSLILLADGAPQESVELVRAIEDPRVHVEQFDERGGLAKRLNTIAAMADTPFLFRMDADDVMHPERIAQQLPILTAGSADLVATRAYLIDGDDRLYGLMKEPPRVPERPQDFLGRGIFTHPTIAAASEWFRENPYDETLMRAQDKALYIKTAATTRMFKMPTPLLYWRVLRPVLPSRQARASRYDRIVVRKYGHLVASRSAVNAYILKSHIRQRIFYGLSLLRGHNYLFERKIESINDVSMREASQILDEVLRTPLPGLPSA